MWYYCVSVYFFHVKKIVEPEIPKKPSVVEKPKEPDNLNLPTDIISASGMNDFKPSTFISLKSFIIQKNYRVIVIF